MSRRKTIRVLFCLAAISLPLFLIAEEKIDLSIVSRIKSEAFENSKVMDHMFLSDRCPWSPADRFAQL